MATSRQRTLITGGSGFIGANLTRALIAAGHDVHLLLRPHAQTWRLAGMEGRHTVHFADLRDADSVRRAVAASRPEVIYHLASYGVLPTQQQRSTAISTNLGGLAHLLDALEEHDYRSFVHSGTCWEYGHRHEAIREDDPCLEPRTVYAVAKAAASLLCQAEARTGRPVTTVRIFAAYGPEEEPARLVPYVMGCCARGESPCVSSGDQVRDFIHVNDVVHLLQAAAACPKASGRILHAGTGRGHSVRHMIETILAVCGQGRVKANYGASPMRKEEPATCVADIAATKALTGWEPRYDLHSGVAFTWTRFRGGSAAAA